ncbi:MAG: dienelactone hydrolase family protein [Thermoleophilaceae bacterium]
MITAVTVPGQVDDLSTLDTAEVAFTGAGGQTIDGYLAAPTDGAGNPGLIVIHEAMGLNEHIRDVARRFAALGYTALAPDLYTREGAPPEDFPKVMAAIQAVPDERAVGDLEGAAEFVRAWPGASGKVGCIGFCSGGRHALLFACSGDSLDAAVDCWGGNVLRASKDADTTPERPVPVIDMIDRLSCPLYVVVGAEDQNPSRADAERLRERLSAAGKVFHIDVYDGAGHAFFADYRPTYREKPAQRMWDEVTAFFAERLH